jgi:dethiobiotin synthetase
VIGRWPAGPGLAERHNRDDLARYTGVPVLGAVPDGAGALPAPAFRARAAGWLGHGWWQRAGLAVQPPDQEATGSR